MRILSRGRTHAIKAAAEAVSRIDCGRVGDLTVNVGTITGGTADNIVPETCVLTGEVRGFDHPLVLQKLAEIEEAVRAGSRTFRLRGPIYDRNTLPGFQGRPGGTGRTALPRSLRGGRAGKQSDRNLRRQRQQPFLPARTDRPCCRARYECLPQLSGIHKRG